MGGETVISKLHANLTRQLAALLPSAPLGIRFSRGCADRGGVAVLRVAQTKGCGVVFGDILCFSGAIPKRVISGSTCQPTTLARLVSDTVASKLRFLLLPRSELVCLSPEGAASRGQWDSSPRRHLLR